MGKYDLKNVTIKNVGIDSHELFLNDVRASEIERSMQRQLEIMRASLLKINMLLTKAVNKKYVKGSQVDAFRGWAHTAKSQSETIGKLKGSLIDSYSDDLKNYSLKLLDERISELEKKLADMTKE